MSVPNPLIVDTSAMPVPASEKSISRDDSKEDLSDGLRSRADSIEKVPLADRATQDPSSSLGDAILRLLRLRKRRPEHDLDSIATQSSVFDTEQAEFYKPKDDWEVSKVIALVAVGCGARTVGADAEHRKLRSRLPMDVARAEESAKIH